MNASIKSLGIDRLPIEERLALVEQKRIEEDDARPDDVTPWEQIKASTLSRLGQ